MLLRHFPRGCVTMRHRIVTHCLVLRKENVLAYVGSNQTLKDPAFEQKGENFQVFKDAYLKARCDATRSPKP